MDRLLGLIVDEVVALGSVPVLCSGDFNLLHGSSQALVAASTNGARADSERPLAAHWQDLT